MSTTNQTGSGSRSRPQVRKKITNEDASYIGPSASALAGSKRQAADRAEGEPKAKRKRVVDTSNGMPAPPPRTVETETRISMVDFVKMSGTQIQSYLAHHSLIPVIHPLPTTVHDPPPPYTLANPHAHRAESRPPSPPPHITPANRPRRDPKDPSRRRSSRLLDDDVPTRAPIMNDVQEIHVILAGIAEKHFREVLTINGREEVETLAEFMCAVERLKSGKVHQ
ncbi:hypothetical protein K435DRAFT_959146 [Dendrothele bispora CBS 962.96]|uniref:Histone deacetylase complex subunit SAP30 Sin3 binding domain-containing protein n=1 Tax=Dendrothele bispora (strain CBS 962.96) TaxID=1314807 RepID=A0A4S8MZ51_DENBC|nr:hypothetical protein K435DRAFT_959146 [Dendrothele bispora CBS 962.96]